MRQFAIALLLSGIVTSAQAEPLAGFDVAEDMTRFVHGTATLHEDGLPGYGTPFITQGYIYPAGTLDGGVEGTLADGSPAFPDLVLGVWTCDGYLVGEGFHTRKGDVVISKQTFQFKDGSILITQGSELIDAGVPVIRAATGGTGDYAGVGPAVTQVMLGMSDGYGARLRIELSEARDQAALSR